jgi:hypothetical protein
VYNNSKTAQVKKKKKTRGNPFRVLMGKVGKLLDHGVEKNDIVRYISKLKYWNKETIERAIDIVKEYNKKLEQGKDKDEKPGKSEKATDKVDIDKIVKEKTSKNASVKTAALNYDAKPNFEKRSTPELIFRVCYLLELDDYSKTTPQGHGKDAADKKGVKEEIKQIKQALTTRGMSKDEMDKLGFGK